MTSSSSDNRDLGDYFLLSDLLLISCQFHNVGILNVLYYSQPLLLSSIVLSSQAKAYLYSKLKTELKETTGYEITSSS